MIDYTRELVLICEHYRWNVYIGSFVGDSGGNITVLKLDQSCRVVQMEYTIPLSASHGEIHISWPILFVEFFISFDCLEHEFIASFQI